MTGVENKECGKRGVWKTRSVENAECGKLHTPHPPHSSISTSVFNFAFFHIKWAASKNHSRSLLSETGRKLTCIVL